MSELLEEWVNKADGDFHTALRESEVVVNPNYDAVCFHAQQCIEKLLKVFLISRQIAVPKTHDLAELGRIASSAGIELPLPTEDLHFLTRAAVDFRYPGESADMEEAKEALGICARLRNILLSLLPHK